MPRGRVAKTTKPEHAGLRTDTPIIGRITVGELFQPEGSGKPYPKSLDYFRATGAYAKLFHEAYGDEPKSIEVTFLSNDITQACSEQREWRDAKGAKVAFDDGEGVYEYVEAKKGFAPVSSRRVWVGDQDQILAYEQNGEFYRLHEGKFITKPVAEEAREAKVAEWDAQLGPSKIDQTDAYDRVSAKYGPGKVTTTLRFAALKVRGVAGLWQLTTRAEVSSGPAIQAAFDQVMASVGRVTLFPFDLVIEKVTSKHPSGTRSYPVVKLVFKFAPEDRLRLTQWMSENSNYEGIITNELVQGASQAKQLGDGKDYQDYEEVK